MAHLEFTAGPWLLAFDAKSASASIYGPRRDCNTRNSDGLGEIVTVHLAKANSSDHSFAEQEPENVANARLIAAAPQLYEALRDLDALPVKELSAGVDSTMRPVSYMAYSAYDVQRIVRAALAMVSPHADGKENA